MSRVPPSLPLPRNVAGMLWMLFASAGFTLLDATVRHIASTGIHPFEVVFFRNLLGLITFLPFLWRYGPAIFRAQLPGRHLARALVQTASALAMFLAVTLIPFAEFTALLLTAPLFSTLGALLFLGERAGVRRWTALVLGMAGGLVIVRPGLETVELGTICALVGAGFFATQRLLGKVVIPIDGTVTATVYMSLGVTVFGFVACLPFWVWPTAEQYVWLLFAGVLGTTALLASGQALKLADVSVTEPTSYTRLVWAALLGFFLFGEVPDLWVWAGAALIVGSSSYIAHRESRLRRLGTGAAAATRN